MRLFALALGVFLLTPLPFSFVVREDREISGSEGGTLILLFGSAEIEKRYEHTIIAVGSELMLAAGSDAPVWALASSVYYEGEHIEALGQEPNVFVIRPGFTLSLIFALIMALICSALHLTIGWFIEQGSLDFAAHPLLAAQAGITIYLVGAGAILLCILSVVLLPLAALGFILFAGVTIIGQTCIALWLGRFSVDAVGKALKDTEARSEWFEKLVHFFKSNTVAYTIFGVIMIEAAALIPHIGLVFRLSVLPALAGGALARATLNVFSRKVFYAPEAAPAPKSFRETIVKGLNKNN